MLPSAGSTPLGLHRLGDIVALDGIPDRRSGAYLANEDPLRARSSEQGMVLVTDFNSQSFRGAMFGLVLQNVVGGNTDSWPFGTFQVR
jgi:hypothetical protein